MKSNSQLGCRVSFMQPRAMQAWILEMPTPQHLDPSSVGCMARASLAHSDQKVGIVYMIPHSI